MGAIFDKFDNSRSLSPAALKLCEKTATKHGERERERDRTHARGREIVGASGTTQSHGRAKIYNKVMGDSGMTHGML
jgi:hypothetical protein